MKPWLKTILLVTVLTAAATVGLAFMVVRSMGPPPPDPIVYSIANHTGNAIRIGVADLDGEPSGAVPAGVADGAIPPGSLAEFPRIPTDGARRFLGVSGTCYRAPLAAYEAEGGALIELLDEPLCPGDQIWVVGGDLDVVTFEAYQDMPDNLLDDEP